MGGTKTKKNLKKKNKRFIQILKCKSCRSSSRFKGRVLIIVCGLKRGEKSLSLNKDVSFLFRSPSPRPPLCRLLQKPTFGSMSPPGFVLRLQLNAKSPLWLRRRRHPESLCNPSGPDWLWLHKGSLETQFHCLSST